MANIGEKIIELLKEGLELWKVFISTREEAYKRKRDKQQEKAIQWGEREFELTDDILNWVAERHKDDKEVQTFIKIHHKNKRYFNKYD